MIKVVSPYSYPGIDLKDRQDWLVEKQEIIFTKVIEDVASDYKILPSDILSDYRQPDESEARAVCLYFLHKKLGYTQRHLSVSFNRHRTTVLNRVKFIKKRMHNNTQITDVILKLEKDFFIFYKNSETETSNKRKVQA